MVLLPLSPVQNTVRMRGINEHITCSLCAGYLIEATTITECLHTCETHNNKNSCTALIVTQKQCNFVRIACILHVHVGACCTHLYCKCTQ